ncbi:hypothetical protein G5B97_05635 [Campylobacter concisus]|uniref:hypothetical protein n=1 Tax=Campylobacter concisus TaxID=199 RepID=UPI0018ABE068|nr:hypothetical protein [Campylobacter concisus]QPH99588.1 hypothetical protein G5B98_05420 [Campylobacter concisus]QPI01384.1 hypothetical protein G5B97_05635 [Campylobacter concisus]
MKKIGRISALKRRVVRQNSVVSLSIIVDKMRFSETFSPEIYKYEVGDLVRIKYKKVGFLNKIETIRLIATNRENSDLYERLKNLFYMIMFFYFSLFLLMVIYYMVLKNFSIIGAILVLCDVWLLNTVVRVVYYQFLIFRYFIFG